MLQRVCRILTLLAVKEPPSAGWRSRVLYCALIKVGSMSLPNHTCMTMRCFHPLMLLFLVTFFLSLGFDETECDCK
jgi:hypothetical protein